MPNTITDLFPEIYAAYDIVSRELTGFIPASMMDAERSRAAVGQEIRSHIAPASASANATPGQLPPDTGDQVIGSQTITITKDKIVPVRWTGEEQVKLRSGVGYRPVLQDQIAQAMRTLVNEIEADIGTELRASASRATGVAGTTPFASDLDEAADVLKVLEDNGAPGSDLQLVIDTAAGTNLRKLTQLQNVNTSGGEELLRRGILLDLFGFDLRQSAGVNGQAAGTGSGYLVNDASLGVGDTVITVDTGSGTIVAGDVVTFAADAVNQYVVTEALSGATFTIGKPGLKVAIPDSNAITVKAASRANVAFHRNASVVLMRAPAIPEEGDSATDREMIGDAQSGLVFEIAFYGEYRRVHMEVGAVWGQGGVKEDHTALMLG